MILNPIIDRIKRIAELLPTAIGGITPTGTKTINVTHNGTVTEDVTNYANAEVITNVPQGVFPSGTKTINVTQNGTVTEDVTNYANAEVITNVPQGVFPSGTKTINVTHNGTVTEDVTNYATAEVITNVPQGVFPSGTKTINVTQNGTVTEDVTNYANAEVNVNVPTVENCYITTTTLATHQSTNVTLCEIPPDVYAHRNDPSFSVTMHNLTPSVLENYDEYMITANNNPNNPITSGYPVYGCGLRKSSASVVQPNIMYYPPNSADNTTTLGGLGKFWISGTNLMYKSSSYFLGAGTLKIIFTW